MKKLTVMWVIIMTLMFTLVYSIGLSYSKTFKPYRTLEADYVEAAQIYLDMFEIKLNSYQTMEITSDELMSNNILTESSVDGDECTGYVVIKKKLVENEYKAYIKCQNYTTNDYEE